MTRNKRKNRNLTVQNNEAGEQKPPASALIHHSERQELYWEGPIPPPHVLNAYNDVVPDGAERILKLTENQSAHRLKIEKDVVEDRIKSKRLGQIFAFILSVLIIALGSYMAYQSDSKAGASMVVLTLASLAGVYIWGQQSQKSERIKKKELDEQK